MSTPFSVASKFPDEKLDYTIDWTNPLDGATISSSSFTVPSGLTKESESSSSSTTTVKLSGGALDEEYDVKNTIDTSGGLTQVRFLRIVVGFLVTADEVKAIINTDASDLQPYIIAAYRVVRDNLSSTKADKFTKKEVMRWLAAHFLAMEPGNEGRVQEKEVGEAREVYVTDTGEATGLALGLTRYGQQAIALDPTGKLKAAGKRSATFKAIGFATS